MSTWGGTSVPCGLTSLELGDTGESFLTPWILNQAADPEHSRAVVSPGPSHDATVTRVPAEATVGSGAGSETYPAEQVLSDEAGAIAAYTEPATPVGETGNKVCQDEQARSVEAGRAEAVLEAGMQACQVEQALSVEECCEAAFLVQTISAEAGTMTTVGVAPCRELALSGNGDVRAPIEVVDGAGTYPANRSQELGERPHVPGKHEPVVQIYELAVLVPKTTGIAVACPMSAPSDAAGIGACHDKQALAAEVPLARTVTSDGARSGRAVVAPRWADIEEEDNHGGAEHPADKECAIPRPGGRHGGAATGYESVPIGSTGRYGHSTDDEVGDFAEALVKVRRFDGLVEFFRRLGDLPVDFDGTVHYDPRGSGILARVLTSALEEVPKQQLIALAVHGGVILRRRGPKAEAITALVVAAEKAWNCEKGYEACCVEPSCEEEQCIPAHNVASDGARSGRADVAPRWADFEEEAASVTAGAASTPLDPPSVDDGTSHGLGSRASPVPTSRKGQSKRVQHPIIERLERMNEIQDEIIAIREDLKVWQSSGCRNMAKADIRALKAEYELLEAEHSRCKPSKAAKKRTRR